MLKRTVAVLLITDAETSRKFYTHALGFDLDWSRSMPDGKQFLQISRDGVRVYLKETESIAAPGQVYFYVDDVDRWYSILLDKKVGVDTIPANMPWSNREMLLSDPDGNRIYICTPMV